MLSQKQDKLIEVVGSNLTECVNNNVIRKEKYQKNVFDVNLYGGYMLNIHIPNIKFVYDLKIKFNNFVLYFIFYLFVTNISHILKMYANN